MQIDISQEEVKFLYGIPISKNFSKIKEWLFEKDCRLLVIFDDDEKKISSLSIFIVIIRKKY